MSSTPALAKYSVRQLASKYTHEYRCFLENAQGKVISPFHDVPLFHDEAAGILNAIIEVPRFSNAKLEISKDEFMNPIKQDVKKGAVRFVKNSFPFHGYLWNYGALPQTWESPNELDHGTGIKGDNDPIDVLEIGSEIASTGQVKQVKVLGALAMLDEGETDWKIIVIDINDPLAAQLEDAPDLDRVCPGLVDATRRWFEIYKIPDGKPANCFAFGGAVKDRAYTMDLIRTVNQSWRRLVSGAVPPHTAEYTISTANRTVADSPARIAPEDEARIPAASATALPAAPLPASLDAWHFIPHS